MARKREEESTTQSHSTTTVVDKTDGEPRSESQPTADGDPSEDDKRRVQAASKSAIPGDPALGDVREFAAPHVEGRTSDPATRTEDTPARDVAPDQPATGDKATDDPEYDFPPAGDVDVALLDDEHHEGEYPPPVNVEDWVVLDGTHEDVPDRLDGHFAVVLNAPNQTAPDVNPSPNAAQSLDPEGVFIVRTRDEANTTLQLPFDAFKAVGKGGRNAVFASG